MISYQSRSPVNPGLQIYYAVDLTGGRSPYPRTDPTIVGTFGGRSLVLASAPIILMNYCYWATAIHLQRVQCLIRCPITFQTSKPTGRPWLEDLSFSVLSQ